MSDVVLFPELAPPPPPARPRLLLVATAFASAAAAMAFAGLLGLYLAQRSGVIADGDTWLPDGVQFPLVHANMNAITYAMSVVTIQWAVWSVARDDRVRTYLAMGLTILLGVAAIVRSGFYYTQIGASVRTDFGAVFYTVTGAHVAMTIAGVAFITLMAFRTLGGQYSARDREGVAAAALFWDVTVALSFLLWYTVFIQK